MQSCYSISATFHPKRGGKKKTHFCPLFFLFFPPRNPNRITHRNRSTAPITQAFTLIDLICSLQAQVQKMLQLFISVFAFEQSFSSILCLPSDPVEQWVEPPTLQADLSHLPDPSYDYSVNVTAVIGENISDPSPEDPLDFSYYWSSSASQICEWWSQYLPSSF